MSGTIVLNQLNTQLVNSSGQSAGVSDGYVLTSENIAFLAAGSDGTAAQIISVDTNGVVQVGGTTSSVQSGSWTVKSQDGYGIPLTAKISDPVGTEPGLITRNIITVPTTSSRSSVSLSLSVVTVLNANTSRKGATVYNDSNKPLYLALGSVDASGSDFTVRISPKGYYEIPFGFTGKVSGIWATNGLGNALVSEFV